MSKIRGGNGNNVAQEPPKKLKKVTFW